MDPLHAGRTEPWRPNPVAVELATADRDVPLWKLLGVPESLLVELATYPTEILDPSVRLSNRLKVFRVSHMDQLLRVSLGGLHAIRGVGVGVLQEVLDGLGEFLDSVPPSPAEAAAADSGASTGTPVKVDDRPLQDPVETLGFSSGTMATLEYARIRTLDQLVAALWRIDPILYLDVPAYCEAHERLKALDLRDGDSLAARQALVGGRWAPDLDVVAELCGHVCTEREWHVLEARFGLYPTESTDDSPPTPSVQRPIASRTLHELGDELGITRERVRQIETAALKRVRARGGPLASLGRTLAWLMERAGGVLSLRGSVEDLTPYVTPGTVSPEAICHLVYETSDEFNEIEPGAIYGLRSAPSVSEYRRVIRRAHRICISTIEDVRGDRLVERICADLEGDGVGPDAAFVRACLRADGRYLDAGSPGAKPRRGLISLLAEVLREMGRPAHFTEVAAELNARGWREPVTPHFAHTRLTSRRDLFTYAAPGTYGLAEWGQPDQRPWKRAGPQIGDLCEEFFRERRAPAPVKEIIAYVLARKQCREHSIRAALERDERFEWFHGKGYGLAEWLRR